MTAPSRLHRDAATRRRGRQKRSPRRAAVMLLAMALAIAGLTVVSPTPAWAVNPPVTARDVERTNPGAQVMVDVAANDHDPDGHGFDVVSVDTPANGTASVFAGFSPRRVLYTPNAGFSGIETITYTIRDSGGLLATGTLTITVREGTNRPPVAHAKYLAVDPGDELAVTLTGQDPDGSPLTFSVASEPTGGTLTGTPPNLTYTAPTEAGQYLFTYVANDGTHDSAPAVVYIIVGANRAPIALDDNVTSTRTSRPPSQCWPTTPTWTTTRSPRPSWPTRPTGWPPARGPPAPTGVARTSTAPTHSPIGRRTAEVVATRRRCM